MNLNFGCQNARSLANRLSFFGHSSNKFMMPVVALLALFCGVDASVQAQTASYSGSTSAFDTTHFTNPQGIATDAAGDVFIANNASPSTVYEMVRTAPGVYSAPVALPNPSPNYVMIRGIVIDSIGNLWVADNANGSGGQVYESVNTAGSFGTPTKVGTGWTAPWGMAADASGNVFVADNGPSTISKISGGTVTTLNTGGIAAPRGIALDSSANIFAINGNNFTLMELTAASSYATASTVNTNAFSAPGDIAIDPSGNIWVADFGTNTIREMTFASSYATIMNWGTGLNGPVAVWLDADGNWLVTNFNDNAVRQVATGAVNVGTVAVGSTSTVQTLQFTFTGATSTTIQAPKVVTLGTTAQDFADAGTGTCTTTNGAGHPYASGTSCTVVVNLRPKYAGLRRGGVQLLNTSGTVLATALIYGRGLGPEVVFQTNQATTTLGGGFTQPAGVALDGAGNVYLADSTATVIKEIPTGCTTAACVTSLGGGFNAPFGVAVDGLGNIYVADSGNAAVKEMPAGCGSSACVTTLGGGFSFGTVYGVAVDETGNVYVADNTNNAVDEIPAGCTVAGCVKALGGSFGSPTVVAVDGSDNVYVGGSGSVKEMTPGCTSGACVTSLGGGFSTPLGLTVDAAGNVYVGDYGTGQVKEMPAGCASSSCVAILGSGFSAPAGVKLDGGGNVYVSDRGNGTLKELNLTSGASLIFATTNQGSQSSDSPKTVTLANIGTTALTFPVPNSGQNPSVSANFTLDGSTTCPVVLSSGSAGALAAGASCALNVDFIPATIGQITGSVVLEDNAYNSTYTFQSISLSGAGATGIVPYIQVNNGAWQQTASVTVNAGDTVNLGGQNISGGAWSWTGPNNYTAGTRVINSVPLPSGTNVYTLTYTNTSGVASTQTFTITVNSTPLTPYIQVNGGAWQQVGAVAVNVGDTVNLAPTNISGGSWSWSGPNSYGASSRQVNAVPLPSPSNVYTVTYTNTSGVTSTATFTVTVNGTTLTPYIQVNGGAWQQVGTVAVNVGDTVNLAPTNISGGNWSWSGPNNFTASTRQITATQLPSPSNVYTVTYTNTSGVTSTQTFTVNINGTQLTPYIQVNGGAWVQTGTVAVNLGDTVNLAPTNISGGNWSWTGPNSYGASTRQVNAVPLNSASNMFTVTYTNTSGATSTQTFTININGTAVIPYIEVNGAWQQTSTVAVNVGDTVNLAGQNISGGSWSWTGPNMFTSASRQINGVSLPSGTNVYQLTYTNTAGVASAVQNFTITVNPTALTPYIQVNGGVWQQTGTVSVNVGDTVNLAPTNISGGIWSWTGPNSYGASSRQVNAVPLNSASNVYTVTYTNTSGVTSTQTFTININGTAVIPYIEVNGVWQQTSTVTVNSGDTVNLAGQNINGGSWSWTGPSGFMSTSREIDAVPLASGMNVYTLTYTNVDGVASSGQPFTINVSN